MDQTNATKLIEVWKLPESARLEQQTIGRLSAASGFWSSNSFEVSSSNHVRALLDVVLWEETYFELRQPTRDSIEFVAAVRLDDARAVLWETNFAALLNQIPNRFRSIESIRINGWTLVGIATRSNALLAEVAGKIRQKPSVFPVEAADYLFAGEGDLLQVNSALELGWSIPPGFPKLSLVATGFGDDVHAQGAATFRQPLPSLEKWRIPTDLIKGNLSEFQAFRGIRPWLQSTPLWRGLQAGPAPDQLFVWAMQDLPAQTFFAASSSSASNQVARIADAVLARQEGWFGTSRYAAFERSNERGLRWTGLPFMTPYLETKVVPTGTFIHGGFFPNAGEIFLAPETLQSTLERTNLMHYGWETTGLRVEHWLYMSQFTRMMFQRSQLPFDGAATLWLRAVAPRLGESVTTAAITERNQLSIYRRSSVGFTALELHLLADWLESPNFPAGFHTLVAPRDTRLGDQWIYGPAE